MLEIPLNSLHIFLTLSLGEFLFQGNFNYWSSSQSSLLRIDILREITCQYVVALAVGVGKVGGEGCGELSASLIFYFRFTPLPFNYIFFYRILRDIAKFFSTPACRFPAPTITYPTSRRLSVPLYHSENIIYSWVQYICYIYCQFMIIFTSSQLKEYVLMGASLTLQLHDIFFNKPLPVSRPPGSPASCPPFSLTSWTSRPLYSWAPPQKCTS